MNLNQKNRVSLACLPNRLILPVVLGLLLAVPLQSRAQVTVLSFSNTAPISMPDSFSDADPYPSAIQVPAVAGGLQNLTVTLNNLSNPATDGIELLLVGPSGVGVDLMCFAGSGEADNVNLTIADSGTPFPGGTLTTGTYQPSGAAFANGTSFPGYSPFYQEDTTNHLAGFTSTPLQGTWSLYGYDTDFSGSGNIAGGWTLTLSLVTIAPSVTTLAATGVTPTNATLNANVSPNGGATTVYFEYGTSTAYGQTTTTNSLAANAPAQTVADAVTLIPNTVYHFQAVAQNSLGITLGGDVTFTNQAAPPVIASVPDQTINPESTLVITNTASDANVPPRPVTFSLASGAPTGALITPSGVFSWSPICEQGSTTNAITIWAVDNGTPALSNSITFNVIVNPCVQVTVGSSAVMIGRSTSLPVSLLTTVPLTNVSFTLSTLPGRFANWSVVAASGVTATSQDPDPSQPQFSFGPQGGLPLLAATSLGTNISLGTISVQALATGSFGIATLTLNHISATDTNLAAVTADFGVPGQIVLLTAQPGLAASLTNGSIPVLTLYGFPGSNYVIMGTTNIAPPVTWTPILTNTLSGAIQYFNFPPTNKLEFFRAEQQ